MFEEAAELPEIVIALEVEPRVVRELYEEWRVDLESRHKQRIRDARVRAQARELARDQRAIAAFEERLRRDASVQEEAASSKSRAR